MPTLTPDLARSLSEDDHARTQRAEAAERALALPQPTVEEEIWRYSRIGELDLDRFAPGRMARTIDRPAGLVVEGEAAHAHVGTVMTAAPDRFAAHNEAFADALVIRVPDGRVIDEPIVVTHHLDEEGVAAFPRLIVLAGEDSEVTVVERFTSAAGRVNLVVPVLELQAAQAARVRYVSVNDLGRSTWQIGYQHAMGDRDSSTLLGTVAVGGDYARVRAEAQLAGQGGSTRQVALYYADGDQMHDFRTVQDHVGPRTTSDLLFKGAVQDRARSVYTGLIKIRHEAKGAAAFQTNRNLTLSEGAWAESVPNLEIETNDVRCSHASTIGPIDDDQRFYLESRGIPPRTAERLVVLGFFDEVLGQLPIAALADEVRAKVAAKLDSREAS